MNDVATAEPVGRGAGCGYSRDPVLAGADRGVREKAASVGDERTGAIEQDRPCRGSDRDDVPAAQGGRRRRGMPVPAVEGRSDQVGDGLRLGDVDGVAAWSRSPCSYRTSVYVVGSPGTAGTAGVGRCRGSRYEDQTRTHRMSRQNGGDVGVATRTDQAPRRFGSAGYRESRWVDTERSRRGLRPRSWAR